MRGPKDSWWALLDSNQQPTDYESDQATSMELYSAQYWLVLGHMQELSDRSCPPDPTPLAVSVAVRMA
ncbi:MAG: hypothetical protein RL328_1924 [Acidobacteriota bacterium]